VVRRPEETTAARLHEKGTTENMAWEFDKAHTQIEFVAKHMMVSTVRGRFDRFDGTFDLDEPNPANSKVDVTIDATSITTGQEQRDGHLRSADFLDVEKYPAITFKSTQVKLIGTDRAEVTGDLTIKDVTRPAVLEVTRAGSFTDLQGNTRDAYAVTASISRKDWGLTWNVALESGGWLVSDQIKINIETEVFVPKQVAETVAATTGSENA
jgi:polyisoprenoid-binding protein YceI